MESEQGLFSNLPSPITIIILSRLPIKTIFRCRSVCKNWLKLISDPEFVHLHRARSPVELLINNTSCTAPGSGCFNIVGIEDKSDHHDLHYVAEKKMEVPTVEPNSFITMIGSIDGLVCLVEIHSDAVHVWNPATRECITIENPEGERIFPNVISYGFGLSSVKGQFHVVRIFQARDKNDPKTICKSECQVYTLGTGSWRGIGHAPFLHNCRESGIFLNGNLHWLIHDEEGLEFVSCLELETESFQPFPSPPELRRDNLATLNTYGECLCVCDNTSDFDIVIWTMKEYGVKTSWSREAVISKYPIDLVGNYYEVVHVVKVFKDGEVLLIWRDDWFLSYHLERKTLVDFDARDLIGANRERLKGLEGLPPCVEAMDYVSSVFSLKDFEKEMVKVI